MAVEWGVYLVLYGMEWERDSAECPSEGADDDLGGDAGLVLKSSGGIQEGSGGPHPGFFGVRLPKKGSAGLLILSQPHEMQNDHVGMNFAARCRSDPPYPGPPAVSILGRHRKTGRQPRRR